MQTVNNNKPEQINSALFAISDDITKQVTPTIMLDFAFSLSSFL